MLRPRCPTAAQAWALATTMNTKHSARRVMPNWRAMPCRRPIPSRPSPWPQRNNPAGDAAEIAAEAQAALRERAANSGEPVVHAEPSNPQPQTVTNAGGISDETNFDAVSAERSIEADAARVAQNRAQYQVIDPRPCRSAMAMRARTSCNMPSSTSHPSGHAFTAWRLQPGGQVPPQLRGLRLARSGADRLPLEGRSRA